MQLGGARTLERGGFIMRFTISLMVVGALALVGCGDEGSDGSGGSGGAGGGGSGPAITMVAWEAEAGCATGVRSDVVVTVTATGGAGALTYSGSVGGCEGSIDAAVSTISCPNVATYPGTVMVSDGTDSTTVSFDVPVCDSSSCTTDPDTCS